MLYRSLAAFLLVMLCANCDSRDRLRVAYVPHDWFNAPLTLAALGWPGAPIYGPIGTFTMESGLASKTAVASGNAEIGLASPVVLLRDPNAAEHIRLLGCYMRSPSVIGLATKGDEFRDPVGYVAGTISEVYLALLLDKLGRGTDYRAGKIRTISLLPPNTALALKDRGGVNSIVIWEPHLSRAAKETGAKLVLDPTIYTVNVCLIANRDAYRTGTQAAIDRFASRVSQASLFIISQPGIARKLTEANAGLAPDALATSWSHVDFRYTVDRSVLLDILGQETAALTKAGMLHNPLNIRAFLE